MHLDVPTAQHGTAYTIVLLPADFDGKTNASVLVKVYTGAGVNVMSCRVFERLYPKQMNLNGEPTGLATSTAKLTAYYGM